jgi:CopG family nickel-responsive transcriptional regulator
MSKLVRFGVSIPAELSKQFDDFLQTHHYSNRSEALRDLIREKLVQQEWKGGKDIAGAILLVYDHHQRDLVTHLTDIQHDYHHLIISSQHIHIDHHNCLETIIVKGKTCDINDLAAKLRSMKGVKYSTLAMATTGKEIG